MTPTPVHLITGLLGAGKTTCLTQLLSQRPSNERWGLLINEFGDIDIDEASLQNRIDSDFVHSTQVSGGCVCCSAHLGLTQGLETLLATQPDRIFIEPTGLGHSAKIIDTLKEFGHYHPLNLQAIVCVITPQQLSKQRWQKSAVMRDLVNLADIILLNKTDLADQSEIEHANALLKDLYPSKQQILLSEQGELDFSYLLAERTPVLFRLLEGVQEHEAQHDLLHHEHKSLLPGTLSCQTMNFANQQLRSYAWQGEPSAVFNRTQLKKLFEDYGSQLERAKGLIRTGKEWQLLNWSEQQLTLCDQSWRQDNRLEFIFETDSHITNEQLKAFEIQLLSTIN